MGCCHSEPKKPKEIAPLIPPDVPIKEVDFRTPRTKEREQQAKAELEAAALKAIEEKRKEDERIEAERKAEEEKRLEEERIAEEKKREEEAKEAAKLKEEKEWEALFLYAQQRLKEPNHGRWCFTLVLAYEIAEWMRTGTEDGAQLSAYQYLEGELARFAKAKPNETSRLVKLVIRYLQRKLVFWSPDPLPITLPALHNRHLYAQLDKMPRKSTVVRDEKNWADTTELTHDTATIGWFPTPKADEEEDHEDVWKAGEVESVDYSASDPIVLFYKLRFACFLGQTGRYRMATLKLEPPVRAAIVSPNKDVKTERSARMSIAEGAQINLQGALDLSSFEPPMRNTIEKSRQMLKIWHDKNLASLQPPPPATTS